MVFLKGGSTCSESGLFVKEVDSYLEQRKPPWKASEKSNDYWQTACYTTVATIWQSAFTGTHCRRTTAMLHCYQWSDKIKLTINLGVIVWKKIFWKWTDKQISCDFMTADFNPQMSPVSLQTITLNHMFTHVNDLILSIFHLIKFYIKCGFFPTVLSR